MDANRLYAQQQADATYSIGEMLVCGMNRWRRSVAPSLPQKSCQVWFRRNRQKRNNIHSADGIPLFCYS